MTPPRTDTMTAALEGWMAEGRSIDWQRFSPWERDVLSRAMDIIEIEGLRYAINAMLRAMEVGS
jgi:hypothetical protein